MQSIRCAGFFYLCFCLFLFLILVDVYCKICDLSLRLEGQIGVLWTQGEVSGRKGYSHGLSRWTDVHLARIRRGLGHVGGIY